MDPLLWRSGPKRLFDPLVGVLLAIGIALPGLARGDAIYRLTDASSYQEGCFDPCLCPLTVPQPVLGTFDLRLTGQVGGSSQYAVEDVHWTVPGGDPELHVRGSGTYTVESPDTTSAQQRLELDLRLGDSAVEHFDSGWLPGASGPHIAIPISIHGMVCDDRVFVVEADPVPASQIQPYTLTDGSLFVRGCFNPCDCLPGQDQPLTGTFSLLPLSDDGLFARYGMVDAQWEVHGSSWATPPDARITGAGSYTVGGEFAVQQQMEAELQVADESPTPFDSGRVVGGGGFPDQIDVEISENGKFCFDTAMHVLADADPVPEPGTTMQLLTGSIGLLGIVLLRSRRDAPGSGC